MNIWFANNLWHVFYEGRTYTRKTQQGLMDLVKLLSNDMVIANDNAA